jgi:hypothetical protein
MQNWAIIIFVTVVIILIIYLFTLLRNANKPEALTREQFAFKCIPPLLL